MLAFAKKFFGSSNDRTVKSMGVRAKAINAAHDAAIAAGVHSTPTFYINGKPLNYKWTGIAEFDKAIADAK